jgi:hypothetical protein
MPRYHAAPRRPKEAASRWPGGRGVWQPRRAMILRDPVHGVVAFEGENGRVLPRLIDTVEVQRLRRVRALGVASMAFPGAEHSRFAHADRRGAGDGELSRAHRAARGGDGRGAQRRSTTTTPSPRRCSTTSGTARSRTSSRRCSRACTRTSSGRARSCSTPTRRSTARSRRASPRCRRGSSASSTACTRCRYLARAVSGMLDVDRCDYLLRDSHMTGTRYGLFDLDWLLRSLRARARRRGPRLAVEGSKGLPAVEGFFLARLFMYQQVYFHKATRAAECVLRSTFRRLADLVADGRVPDGTPGPCRRLARGERISTQAYLSLDDNVLWRAVDAWRDDRDEVLAGLAARCGRRDLFKTASLDDIDPELDETIRQELEAIVGARLRPAVLRRARRGRGAALRGAARPRGGPARRARPAPAAAPGARVVHHRAHRRHALRPPAARIPGGGARGRHRNARGPVGPGR